ncbi:hypothetical protein TNCV_1994251, partial [Trichonephila clavipes]
MFNLGKLRLPSLEKFLTYGYDSAFAHGIPLVSSSVSRRAAKIQECIPRLGKGAAGYAERALFLRG